jgi:hypothetical protein
LLARFCQTVECLAGRLVGGGEPGLAFGEPIGCLGADLLGHFDLAEERLALRLDPRRLAGQPLALRLGFAAPRRQRSDLRLGIGGAFAPGLAFDRNRRQPAGAQLGLVGEAFDRGAGFGERAAILVDAAAQIGETIGELRWLGGPRRWRRLRYRSAER